MLTLTAPEDEQTSLPISTLEDLVHYLSTGEDPHDRIADDIVAEMNFPHSSFTVVGRAALDELRNEASDHDWAMRVESAEPIPDGFVTVIDYDAGFDGHDFTYRTISAVTVHDEKIVRLRHWCTGALG